MARTTLPALALILAIFLLLAGCTQEGTSVPNTKLSGTVLVESNSFQNNGTIPKKYTCDGEDMSPHLKWSNFPKETKAFAVKVIDVDAPRGTFVHWEVANISADKNELKEGEKGIGIELENDFKKMGYAGPCPPPITHHYYFTVYALDSELLTVDAKNFDALVMGHSIATGTLIGTYPAG
jgi:hypothetical protein